MTTSRRLRATVTAAMAGLAAVAFVAGVPALLWAGRLAGLGTMAGTVPATVDGALVLLTAAWAVQRGSGRGGHGWSTLVAVTVVLSAALQVAHARSVTDAATGVELAVALVVGALPPVVTLVAVHAGLELQAGKPAARRATPAPVRKSTEPVTTTPAPVAKPVVAAVPARAPRTTPAPIDVDEVRRLVDAGLSQRGIAERLNTSKSSVARVLARSEAA